MSLHRGIDGPAPLEPEPAGGPAGLHEERRARSTRVAFGTLACPSCDAPVAPPAAPMAVSAPLACGWCGHGGAVREFLALAAPTRPTHVEVHVRAPVP